MHRKTYLCIILVLTVLTIVSTVNIVEAIRVGDKLEYDFKILFEYRMISPKTSLQLGSQQVTVECHVKWEISGVMIYQINEITTEEISIKISYRGIKTNYFVKCNDTETENNWRNNLEDASRRMSEELKREIDFEIPLRVKLNETITTSPLPTGLPISTPFGLYTGFPNIWFNYTVVESTYRNRPCLLIKTWGEIEQSLLGLVMKARGNGQTFTDITGSVIYYSVSEVDLEMRFEASSGAVFQGSFSGSFKVKIELELRNINEIERYRTTGFEIKFKEKRGSVLLSGYDIKLNSYRIDGRKLVLNISGSGLGGILVNITKDTTLQNIYIDGRITSFVKEEFKDYIIARVPITYSNRIVEIEFGEEIVEVKQIEFEKPLYETFLILSIIVIIIAVPVALIIYILKRLKKT